MIPFRYGDYSRIRRNYMPGDYADDYAGLNIVKSVYVETEWDPRDPVGETRWVESVRKAHGFPHAVICQAWLDRSDVEEVLAKQASFRFVRGVRHKPRSAPHPLEFKRGAPGSMSDEVWRRGYERLGHHSLHFELQTVAWHLIEGSELARDFPEIPIIVNHAGVPADRSPEGLARWREGMAALAECDNVAVKISGLGVTGPSWPKASNRQIVLDVIRMFGVDRCMFASNYPVDRLCVSFRDLYGAFNSFTEQFSSGDRRKMFHDNAMNRYRL